MILSKIPNSFESHSYLAPKPSYVAPKHAENSNLYHLLCVWTRAASLMSVLMLDETHHFIQIMIYTASSECEIFRNLHATKMARVGKIWGLGLDLMAIS